MAIAYDTSAEVEASGTGDISTSYTCSGNNRMLFVFTHATAAAPAYFTAVTYGGVAMTALSAITVGQQYATLWYLTNPAFGSNTLLASWPGNSSHSIIASSYIGTRPYSPILESTTSTTPGQNPTATVSTSMDNSWGLYVVLAGAGVVTGGTNATLRQALTLYAGLLDTNGPKTPIGSLSMTATTSNTATAGQLVTFGPIKEIAATDTISQTDSSSIFKGISIVVSDAITMTQRIVKSLADTLLMNDTMKIKFLWKNAVKNVTTWINNIKQ